MDVNAGERGQKSLRNVGDIAGTLLQRRLIRVRKAPLDPLNDAKHRYRNQWQQLERFVYETTV
jgi:hypothetical protein